MSLCDCSGRPQCEVYGGSCERPADWTVFTPPGRWIKTWPYGRFTFMCTLCKDYYVEEWKKPLKGIDRPPGADEDWRPSLMEHIRHAQIAIAFEERKERDRLYGAIAEFGPVPRHVQDYTPAQLSQYAIMRRAFRDFREGRL